MTKIQKIEDLYQDTMKQIISSPEEWRKFLNTASKMYRYDFSEQLLIYAQKPDAEACATIDVWNKNMHCWVNRGSKGIALLDRNKNTGEKTLKYVFDVSNVHKAENIGKYPYLWVFRNEHKDSVIHNLEEEYNLSLNSQIFADNIRQMAEQIATEEVDENFKYILEDSQDSYLEDVSQDELRKCYRTILASSITYSVLSRCGTGISDIELDFSHIHEFNSESILVSIGEATSNISEKILLTIGKTIREYNREHKIYENRLDKIGHTYYNNNKGYEESNINIIKNQGGRENEHRIHSERRLSDSELDTKRATGDSSNEMGIDGEKLFAGNTQVQINGMGDARRGQNEVVGDSGESRNDVYQFSGGNEEDRERNRGTQSRESIEVGTSGQQYPAESRGNSENGSYISDLDENHGFMQMTLFPSFEEQSGNIAVAVAREENTLASAIFSIPEEVIIDALKLGGAQSHSQYFIYQHYIHDQNMMKFKKFVMQEYDSIGHGIVFEGTKYSVWFNESGMNIASGTSAFGRNSYLIEWSDVTERIAKIIEGGNFISKDAAYLSKEYVMNELATDLLLHFRDVYGKLELKEDFNEKYFLERLSDENRIKEISKMLWEIDDVYRDKISVRSYRINKRLIDDVYNISKEPVQYEFNMEYKEAEASFITQDEIDYVLNTGSGFEQGKERIYEFFIKNNEQKDRVNFLKKEYGIGSRSPGGLGKLWSSHQDHDAKGLKLSKGKITNPFTETLLSWNVVANRISELIQDGKYLSPEQIEILANDKIVENASKSSVDSLEHDNYLKFDELFTDMFNGKVTYKRFAFDSDTFEPLSVGYIGNNCFSIMHTFVQNGDLMRDPDIVVKVDRENQTISAVSYENSSLGIYEELNELDKIKDCNIFLETWLKNIEQQKQPLREEHINYEGQEIIIEFAENRQVTSIDCDSEEILDKFKEDASERFLASNLTNELQENKPKNQVYDREVEILDDVLARIKLDDIILNFDENGLVARDNDNVWHGAEFYRFLVEEAFVFNKDSSIQLINGELFEDFKKLSERYGIEIEDNSSKEIHDEINKENVILSVKHNFNLKENEVENVGRKERFHRNAESIKVLRECENENRFATPEEQIILSKYVGWGGLADCFDENKPAWKNEYLELKSILTEEEYSSARESVLNAHYTSPVIIREMYNTLDRLGFVKGNILEPACGIGNFFGMIPEKFNDSKLYGVELDDISGRIAQKLYPDAKIDITGYEKTNYPNDFFDVAIGNVPFGDYRVNDREYQNENFLIHDYFFAKSLDKVRSGGIVAFITSKGTLDKKDDTVRRYLAERAELLGAVRLPNIAFKANAGTEVTSDIIFLKKRDGLSHEIPEWVTTSYNNDEILMNSYFIEHPEMIVGKMQMVSGPFGMESTCILEDTDTFQEKLVEALRNIEGEIELQELDEVKPEEKEEIIPALPGIDNFSYAVVDEKIYYRENSIMLPIDVSENHRERVKGLIEIRECTYKLIELQINDYNDIEIKAEQQKLNDLYDEFEKKYGRISSKVNAKYFDSDSGYPMICSLEIFDEDKFIRKADIFSKRTIKKAEKVTSVDTASEALTLSLNEKGKIDLSYMSELSGKKEEFLAQELKGIIFKNPLSGQWESADEYLAGNVRNKLSVARNFAKTSDEFIPNVEALEKVQPKDLDASEIDIRLGATWIDTDIITDFVKEVLKPSEYMFRYEMLKIMYSEYTHEWRIKGKNTDSTNPLVNSTYGTNRINAYKILEDTLNLKDVQVYDKIENADGSTSRKLNQKETTIALQKQDALKDAFKEWVFKDRDRRVALCNKYNQIFNSIRPREYVGDNLTFSGMAMDITLNPHQKNAVARQLYGPNTLLAHCVGAGKTFEMTAAAMESKRLGLCRKSLFVVPNHLIGDWAKDFLRLYPGAKILAATKKDFTPQNRKKFCSRIATGDYDAVIIGHSQFEKIPLSIERQASIIQSQINEIENAIREAKYANGDSFSIKQMEKMRKQLNVKLEKLYDSSKKDSVVTFEQLGVDRLFVDESHYYKNLFHYTKMRNVSGLSSTEAAKSSDMYAKCMYLDEITGGTGITFATGTPISNSMTELYTNMRYLQSAKLNELGLSYFDAWASTFGETVTEMELAPEGTGFRLKTRFAKFHNIPELINIFKECADIQTSDMLKLPVPEAEYVDVVLEASQFQKNKIKELGMRAEDIRNGNVDPKVDNMLKITNDGRFLALDERMVNPELQDNENNKSTECADRAYQIWKDTEEQHSTQLIFSDISTPNKDGRFSIYEDIKEKLINRGVPESEIAFIHDYNTEKKKSDLFSKVRKGQVRFLFGSTQKMGAGTNVQDKLIALHHLDVPWRPSDIEQQEGRILRQGNENPKVKIFRYIKKGTFDSYSWQLIEKKQRFISQIMTSKAPVRSADDIDDVTLNYAEVKALATGNPKIKEKMELDVEVQKLRLLRASFLNQKYRLEDAIAVSYPNKIEAIKERITAYKLDIKTVEEQAFEDDNFEMKIGETIFRDKKDAGEALLSMIPLTGKTSDYTKIGEYRGFQMSVSYDLINSKYVMKLKGQLSHMFHLSEDASGNITRINNALAALPEQLEKSVQNKERIEKELADAIIEVEKEFPKEQEYKEKSERLKELEEELNMDSKHEIQNSDTMDMEEKLDKINENVSECRDTAEKISQISKEFAYQNQAVDKKGNFTHEDNKTVSPFDKTIVAIESTDDYINYEWGFNPVDGKPKYRLVQIRENDGVVVGYPGDMFLDFNSMDDLNRYIERESDKIEMISYDEIITKSLTRKGEIRLNEQMLEQIDNDISGTFLSRPVSEIVLPEEKHPEDKQLEEKKMQEQIEKQNQSVKEEKTGSEEKSVPLAPKR